MSGQAVANTAVVLAGPERKRILRELLSLPEPWPLDTRDLYTKMLLLEYGAAAGFEYTDALADATEKRTFGRLIFQGASEERARKEAALAGRQAVLEHKREHSPGRRARERRRTFREAVTAGDGALAVTTLLVETCIVCGGPFPPHCRSDAAYCSNACRTAAYRKRRMAPRKPISAVEKAARDAERQKMEKAARDAGLSRQDIGECIRVANVPEMEFERLLSSYVPGSMTQLIRAMRRRAARGGQQ